MGNMITTIASAGGERSMDYPDGSNLVPWRWKQKDFYMSKSEQQF